MSVERPQLAAARLHFIALSRIGLPLQAQQVRQQEQPAHIHRAPHRHEVDQRTLRQVESQVRREPQVLPHRAVDGIQGPRIGPPPGQAQYPGQGFRNLPRHPQDIVFPEHASLSIEATSQGYTLPGSVSTESRLKGLLPEPDGL